MSQHSAPRSFQDAQPRPEEAAQLEFDGQAGAALHHRRRSLGLTATEVGRRIGISQRRMARLELGLEPLTLRLAIGLGAVLGMQPGWFLRLQAASVAEASATAVDGPHGDWARALGGGLTAAREPPQ